MLNEPQPIIAARVGAAYSYGWNTIWKYFLELLLIVVVAYLLTMPASLLSKGDQPGLTLLAFLYLILIGIPISFGMYFAFLKAVRRETVRVGDMFNAFGNYWNAVLAGILAGVLVLVGFALLIVPGIIIGCRLAFVWYLITDRRMDAISAVKESWRLTKGHAWKIFGIFLLAIPVMILGMLALAVGIIPAMMWIYASNASLYYAVAGAPEPVDTDKAPITP